MLNGRILAFIFGLLAILISLLVNMDLISNLIAKLVKELAFEKWTDAEEMEVIEAWRKIIIPTSAIYRDILIGYVFQSESIILYSVCFLIFLYQYVIHCTRK